MSQSWRDITLVGFDIETSGAYPLAAEICEIGAVKWVNGEIVDKFQSLVAVNRPIPKEIIAIHHIDNDMLIGAPELSAAIIKFYDFIKDSYLIAHHAPFDMGFIAPAFELVKLPWPQKQVFCSSLLARNVFPESTNHKLQTLIQFFNLPQGQAHRAEDDALACLRVGLKTFQRIGEQANLNEIYQKQGAKLDWSSYGMQTLRQHPVYGELVRACEAREPIQIVYQGGSRPGQARTVIPMGIVRNPLDDYFVACEKAGDVAKRYFLNKITAARF